MKTTTLIAAAALLTGLAACNGNSSTSSTTQTDSATSTTTATPATDAKALELVFQDSTYQFTGIAKEEGGRLFISYPRWSGPYRFAVGVVQRQSGITPYPDSATNNWDETKPGMSKWVCVQMPYVDDKGTLWILDPSAPKLKMIKGGGAKLVKMGKDNKPERTYTFNGVISDTSYVNDVRIDTRLNYAYMTDSKTGGIVALDLASGKAHEVLKGHSSTISDPAYKFVVDGHELYKEGKPAKFNSDGIALTPDGAWLYYKPLSDDKLYRIETKYLRDAAMSEKDIEGKVADLGHFNCSDGMIFDKAGNLYMGDPQNYNIVKLDKDLKKTVLIADKRLIWPDSYAIADGYLYVTCSQINLQPDYNGGVNKRTTPYAVYRIKL